VLNHNLETVHASIAKRVRDPTITIHALLRTFKQRMLRAAILCRPERADGGLGETDDEIIVVMRDLRAHDVNAHDRPVSGAEPASFASAPHLEPRCSSASRAKQPRSVSPTRPARHSCVPATTLISRSHAAGWPRRRALTRAL